MSKHETQTSNSQSKIVLERTYRARVDEIWDLWTTKDGFESWWGPDGFRVEVHRIDAQLGGELYYDMIADAPAQIAAMKQAGQPTSHETRGKFTRVEPLRRLEITHVIDFIPGLSPYESTMTMELFPYGESVRMVVTLDAMHNQEFSKMQAEGFTSQLGKLDRRFEPGRIA